MHSLLHRGTNYPPADISGDAALRAFQAKGFTAEDLAAHIGSHSTARQFVTDLSRAGSPTDATPGIWDILYYAQTILKISPFTIPADANLVRQRAVGPFMKRFSLDKFEWDRSFAKTPLRKCSSWEPKIRAAS